MQDAIEKVCLDYITKAVRVTKVSTAAEIQNENLVEVISVHF